MKKKRRIARTVSVVRDDSMSPPTCPHHPDIYLAILESDEVAVEVMTFGGILHMVCLYGCRVEYEFSGLVAPR